MMRDDEPPPCPGTCDQNGSGPQHNSLVFALDDLFACGGCEEQQGIFIATSDVVASNSFDLRAFPIGDQEITEVASLE
jgi:hypothetical protein